MPEGRTVQDAIADAVGLLETELRMTDARIRRIGWDTATSHRTRVNSSWDDVSFNRAGARYDDDGDALASQVLNRRRQEILLELGELRQRLVGQAEGARRGWG